MRLTLIVLLLCGSLFAENRKEWEASPEAYFMTSDERRVWERIDSDAEARHFIDAFRARRGADFSAEVQRRAALVDERLALGEVKASTTLRGRIAMLLGAPAELEVRGIPTATRGNWTHAVATRKGGATSDRAPQPNLIGNGAGWVEYTFRYAPNPTLGIGPEGWSITTEANGASGKDRLKYRRHRQAMEDVLEAAAQRSILAR